MRFSARIMAVIVLALPAWAPTSAQEPRHTGHTGMTGAPEAASHAMRHNAGRAVVVLRFAGKRDGHQRHYRGYERNDHRYYHRGYRYGYHGPRYRGGYDTRGYYRGHRYERKHYRKGPRYRYHRRHGYRGSYGASHRGHGFHYEFRRYFRH